MYSLSEIGRLLGIDRRTALDLAKRNNVPVVAHPSNGKAKAVDEAGFKTIKKAWERAAVAARG